MSDHEFQRVLGYATAAMDLLKNGQVPPYPQFYELLYTYATGVNPSLNSRLNAILRAGQSAGSDLAKKLYEEFLRDQDAGERISQVSERMHTRIQAVHSAIDTAMASAAEYSGSLESASSHLAGALEPEELGKLVDGLLDETRRMQDTNKQLQQKLAASRDEMVSLQLNLEEVRRESMLDPLTKICNRKSFDEGLMAAVAHATATGEPLALMLVDIDFFKRFNDTYGHQTGDQVLRLMAMTLKSNIKGKDLAARYGGEEFAAILPATDLLGAVMVAENVRRAMQAKELLKRSTNEKLGRITASFGVAIFRAGEDSISSLIERADRCLYGAKHAGRNCVVNETELESEIEAELSSQSAA